VKAGMSGFAIQSDALDLFYRNSPVMPDHQEEVNVGKTSQKWFNTRTEMHVLL
jgi:hypothetical protein